MSLPAVMCNDTLVFCASYGIGWCSVVLEVSHSCIGSSVVQLYIVCKAVLCNYTVPKAVLCNCIVWTLERLKDLSELAVNHKDLPNGHQHQHLGIQQSTPWNKSVASAVLAEICIFTVAVVCLFLDAVSPV